MGQDLEVVPSNILFIIVNKSMNKRISAMSLRGLSFCYDSPF